MKKFKFSKMEADLLKQEMSKFASDSVKDVADRFIGGLNKIEPPSHSKGTYSQSYSRY